MESNFFVRYLIHQTTTKHQNNMKTQVTFSSEFQRREDLINNAEFRAMCAQYAKKIGITSQEWNSNKVAILMALANEVCALENNK